MLTTTWAELQPAVLVETYDYGAKRPARKRALLENFGALRVVFTSKLHSYMTSRPCTYSTVQHSTHVLLCTCMQGLRLSGALRAARFARARFARDRAGVPYRCWRCRASRHMLMDISLKRSFLQLGRS